MLWTRDSDLELFVTLTDVNGEYIDVYSNWVTIEVKVGKKLFKAESKPQEETFENCYITFENDANGIMVVIPSESLDFGTVYIRSCMHVESEHYADGYRDVWSIWMPINLAIITEKGFNQ